MNLFPIFFQKGRFEVQRYFEPPAKVQTYEEMELDHIPVALCT